MKKMYYKNVTMKVSRAAKLNGFKVLKFRPSRKGTVVQFALNDQDDFGEVWEVNIRYADETFRQIRNTYFN